MFKSAVSTVPDEAVLIRPKLLRPSSQLAVTIGAAFYQLQKSNQLFGQSVLWAGC